MKGQKLFVRVASDNDQPSISRLYDEDGRSPVRGKLEVVGRLVGDVVAHASIDFRTAAVAEITSVLVAAPLRKKRVGTVLLREIETLLEERTVNQLLVRRTNTSADLFFKRNGFREEGEFLTRDLLFSSM